MRGHSFHVDAGTGRGRIKLEECDNMNSTTSTTLQLGRVQIVKCCKMLFLIILCLSWRSVGAGDHVEGEFVAGTFILTQKSLSEAPHRYADVIKEALDKVANDKDMSYSKSDFDYSHPKICSVTVQRTGKINRLSTGACATWSCYLCVNSTLSPMKCCAYAKKWCNCQVEQTNYKICLHLLLYTTYWYLHHF